jgi:hypothetical protein
MLVGLQGCDRCYLLLSTRPKQIREFFIFGHKYKTNGKYLGKWRIDLLFLEGTESVLSQIYIDLDARLEASTDQVNVINFKEDMCALTKTGGLILFKLFSTMKMFLENILVPCPQKVLW